jgi:hypothetical protein
VGLDYVALSKPKFGVRKDAPVLRLLREVFLSRSDCGQDLEIEVETFLVVL